MKLFVTCLKHSKELSTDLVWLWEDTGSQQWAYVHQIFFANSFFGSKLLLSKYFWSINTNSMLDYMDFVTYSENRSIFERNYTDFVASSLDRFGQEFHFYGITQYVFGTRFLKYRVCLAN